MSRAGARAGPAVVGVVAAIALAALLQEAAGAGKSLFTLDALVEGKDVPLVVPLSGNVSVSLVRTATGGPDVVELSLSSLVGAA